MYPRQPTGGGPLFLMLMGLGVAGAWMWVCHPATAEVLVIQQADGRDAITLMVMVLGALLALTASGGAWMAITNVLSKLAGLLFIGAFGFGCYLVYQNYQENHAGAYSQRVETPEQVQSATNEVTLSDSNQPSSAGPWWDTPAAPATEE